MSERRSEREMSSTDQAQNIARSMFPAGVNWKHAVGSIANRMARHGWTWNRCKDIWFADRRIKISADEIEALRTIARVIPKEVTDVSELHGRIERLESLIAGLASEDVESLRTLIDRLRNLDA
jgi:hypothetical protein